MRHITKLLRRDNSIGKIIIRFESTDKASRHIIDGSRVCGWELKRQGNGSRILQMETTNQKSMNLEIIDTVLLALGDEPLHMDELLAIDTQSMGWR